MTRTRYRLRLPKALAELAQGLHPQLKRKLSASLRTILDDPASGKALRDELAGLRSYRVGRFRIIYRVAARGQVVELVAIGPRGRIYEETLRQVNRDQKANSKS